MDIVLWLPYIYEMILVTGGTGMVGRHLLLELTRSTTLLRAIYRTEEEIEEVKVFFAFAKAASQFTHIDWVRADITNLPELEKAISGITHVYHCAALVSFDPYDFNKLKKVNTEGTANVVNLCLSHKVEKICHLSTIATLSQTPHNPISEENYWNPDAKNSVYAITKYGGEMEVWRATQEGLPAVIFNPGVILGEGDYNSGSGVLFKQVGEGFNYYTGGGTGFIDVKDLVQLMITGMEKPIINERFIAVTHNLTYKNLITAMSIALSKKPPKMKAPSFVLHIYRLLDVLRGWLTRRRKLTSVGLHYLQEVAIYNNKKATEQLELTPTPMNATLDRIAQHFLNRKRD